MTDAWDISSDIALKWTSLDFSDDKSTLVQLMGWCRQATSHYLNQCWPRSLPPYVVTRPQWVNTNEWKMLASRGAAVTIKWCPFCTDTIFRIHQQQIPQSQSRTSWYSHTSTSNKLSYNQYQDRFNCQDLLLWWTDVSLQIGPGCSWNSLFVGLCQRPYLPDKYGSWITNCEST